MSWFESTGLASLAKTALKEAQKQIDKALDIKDDELMSASGTQSSGAGKTAGTTAQSGSKTLPNTPVSDPMMINNATSVWGSFSGSFFDTPEQQDGAAVTTPPCSSLKKIDESPIMTMNKLDLPSDDSVEVLSTPTTPGSCLTSPAGTVHNSESVEILEKSATASSEATPTTATSTIFSPDEFSSPPESVEILHRDDDDDEDDEDDDECEDDEDDARTEINQQFDDVDNKPICFEDEEEEDSMSFNTVSEQVAPILQGRPTGLYLSLQSSTGSNKECNKVNLLEDALLEKSVDQLSDSTQSFEDVQATMAREKEEEELQKEKMDPDDAETATSSDIEIISSPNGDSSSTNSACRTSPSKAKLKRENQQNTHSDASHSGISIVLASHSKKKKGHNRELSEVSTLSTQSIGSDDSAPSNSSLEMEKLLRRISELSELLEAREFKLVEMGRRNAELQSVNVDLTTHLENMQQQRKGNEMDHEDQQDYTQRMSALEKKFQQSIREKEALREQLKSARSELEGKVAKEELDRQLNEKEFLINELRLEGEKLSKQILQHSNIIKKLRTKEKDAEANQKRQQQQIDSLTDETDRLKRSLSAKDEVERSQIDAVHKLSSEKRKLERDVSNLQSQLEDMSQKCETLQTSFDAARKELSEKTQSFAELSKKAAEADNLETDALRAHTENQRITDEVQSLREKIKNLEQMTSGREAKLRHENNDLMRRLEEAELRSEAHSQEISLATIPLVRQLESLQSSLNQRTAAWEKQERMLNDDLSNAEARVLSLTESERKAKEQLNMFQSRIISLEERLSATMLKSEQSSSLLQQKQVEFNLLNADLEKELDTLRSSSKAAKQLIAEEKVKIAYLEESTLLKEKQLDEVNERLKDAEKMNSASKQRAMEDDRDGQCDKIGRTGGNISPAISVERMSLEDSIGSNHWVMDELDCGSISGRPHSLHGGGQPLHTTTTILENLQSTLKQRDGELHQLQWELSRYQADKNYLTEEVSNLMTQLEQLNEQLATKEKLAAQFQELQQRYDALLEMYGEKEEEVQELRLDINDIKEMYKLQIDELLLMTGSTSSNSLSLPRQLE